MPIGAVRVKVLLNGEMKLYSTSTRVYAFKLKESSITTNALNLPGPFYSNTLIP